MNIQENISLKPYNTFGAEATAKFFAKVTSIEELIDVLKNRPATDSQQVLFLGGGSNILFTNDFDGLVILMDFKGISEMVIGENEVLVSAKAGENWHNFVQYCLSKNYGGLENLSLIPGNAGTSPIQNIGAYGVEIKDSLEECRALNLETMEVEEFTNAECKFGYRESIFKQQKGKYVILEVVFKLTTKNHKIHTEYGAIKSELEARNITQPTIQNIAETVIAIRQSKLPDPKQVGNAGSFFKNPVVPNTKFEALKHVHPEIPGYGNGESVKIPAGWMIEQCGWKGKQIGNVACHDKQTLVIINKTGEATGKEIYEFSTKIIDSVREKFGVELEREVNIV